MEEFFYVPPNKPRRILIITTEEKHRQLRYIKAMLGKSWEELLVDFTIQLWNEFEKAGLQGMLKAYKEELEKRRKEMK